MDDIIKTAYEYALIARASYTDIPQGGDENVVKNRLIGDGWTSEMAEYFATHYEVVEGNENVSTGYDALIFREIGTQHYILGNRGTEAAPGAFDAQDLFADIALTITGLTDQIGSLIDFVSRKVLPLMEANPSATFNVAGHSLGGFLTMWTRILFPDQFGTGYTYNGAGVGAFPPTIIDALLQIFGEEPLTVSSANLINYYTSENPEVVAGSGVYGGGSARN